MINQNRCIKTYSLKNINRKRVLYFQECVRILHNMDIKNCLEYVADDISTNELIIEINTEKSNNIYLQFSLRLLLNNNCNELMNLLENNNVIQIHSSPLLLEEEICMMENMECYDKNYIDKKIRELKNKDLYFTNYHTIHESISILLLLLLFEKDIKLMDISILELNIKLENLY